MELVFDVSAQAPLTLSNQGTAPSADLVLRFQDAMGAARGQASAPGLAPAAVSASSGGQRGTVEASLWTRHLEGAQGTMQSWKEQALSLADGLDVSDPRSSLIAIDRQARLTAAQMEVQFALQTADNMKSAVRTLFQQQG